MPLARIRIASVLLVLNTIGALELLEIKLNAAPVEKSMVAFPDDPPVVENLKNLESFKYKSPDKGTVDPAESGKKGPNPPP